jgi:hypothetical protein
VFSILHQE